MFGVIRPLYKEAKRQERGARPPRRTYYAPEPKVYQKEIVLSVLGRAIHNAGAHFSARDLYYAARPLVYAHDEWEAGKQLEYGYFSQTLLTDYQEEHGPIAGLWRDPRGNLHEPHTGKSVALGTREVLAYEFPEYTFDKILYVEKEGEWPKLQAARLAERYDMAIASAKGYPVEAVRELFSRAEGGEYQLFCFHDADLDGYNIARVMREATRRMPGYSVEVVDIGLTVEDALEMDLDPEPFSRKKDISWELRWALSGVAKEYLYRPNPYGSGLSGEALLDRAKGTFTRLSHLWMDGGYNGEDKGADWVEKTLGWTVEIVSRPRKPAPEKVLMAWAKEWAKEGVAVDWQKLLPPRGFVVLPRRWVVERTFSWIAQNRRMSKDYERLASSSEAFIYVAMSRLMVRRLASAR